MVNNARRRSGGGASRFFTALGAFAALVGLVFGLPVLLYFVAPNPIPDAMPGLSEMWTGVSTSDSDGGLFLQVLSAVAWLAWASFVLSVLVEIPAQIRGRRTVRLPGFGMQQRVAAALVAAIASAVIAPGVAAAAVPGNVAPPVAVVTMQGQHGYGVSDVSQTRATGPVSHTVERGESLLDIAEKYGVPYKTIAEANYNVVQPDGRQLSPGQTRVYPGWQLRIPGATVQVQNVSGLGQAVAQAAAAQADVGRTNMANTGGSGTATNVRQQNPSEAMIYEVKRGDWMWYISERFLGDAQRYVEIQQLNPQYSWHPEYPNHIEATWKLSLPEDAYDRGENEHSTGVVINQQELAPAPPAGNQQPGGGGQEQPGGGGGQEQPGGGNQEQPGSGQQPGGSGQPGSGGVIAPPAPTPTAAAPTPTAAAPAPTTAPTTAPATPAPTAAAPTAEATTAPTAAAAPTTPADVATRQASADDDSGFEIDEGALMALPLAGAGLLAALLLTAVFRNRMRNRQHRQPLRRLPQPEGGAIERSLRVVEAPVDVDRLDAALRHLAMSLAERDPSTLPDIVGAWIVDRTVHVILSEPCPNPPAPWLNEVNSWTLRGEVALPEMADDQLAPLPTLVAVGSQPGRHLLLDLERMGSLTIAGDADKSIALLRYIACELACNSWSDDVEVIIAGFPAHEAALLTELNPSRIRATTSVGDAVGRLRRRLMAVQTTLGHTGAADTLAGRVADVAGDSWMPQVLLVANPDASDLELLVDLGEELSEAGRCALAVATTSRAGMPVGQNTVTVTPEGVLHVQLPYLRTSAGSAGLPADELRPLAEIMRVARDIEDVPTPPAPEPEPWALETDASGSLLDFFAARGNMPAIKAVQDLQDDEEYEATYAQPESSGDGWRGPTIETPVLDQDNEPEVYPVGAGAHRAHIETVAAVSAPRREVTVTIPQRRRQLDPNLDEDIRAWWDADPTRPRIGVLGQVEVNAPGPAPEQRQRLHAEIIVYLAQRGARGATADQLTDALWPDTQVKDASRRVAITRARRWLGESADREPWLPDMGPDRTYRLTPGYLLDWHLFRRLRSRGEADGENGAGDLRAALGLVRGVPLDGADRAYAAGARNPYTWLAESDIYPGHIVSAVVDTAHQLAELCLEAGDPAGARWAVERAWAVDPERGDDHPWRDLMRAAVAEGNQAEVNNLLAELMRVRDAEVPEDLSPDTYAWLRPLLPDLLGASTSLSSVR